ncbi:MAG: hypothetical protein QM756_33025 [Polyangiaceae bacterium]
MPRPWLDAAGLVLLKGAVSGAVLWSGFRAVSDDDYARVAIAERFADAPQVDPTGTSWLPFPFYLYGFALKLFGSSLGTATALAVLLGIVSVLLCWWAARLLGLGRGLALGAAAACAVLPYSAYLGVAPVPEAPSAAICVFAAATLGHAGTLRVLGGAALFAACASRYEPWAVALAFAAFTGRDFLQRRERALAIAASLAIAFPCLWLLHGIVRHGDATFFVSRVAAYRAALGPDDSLLVRLWRTPRALLAGEPELTAVCFLLALPALWRARGAAQRAQGYVRFALSLSGVVLLSWLGDVRGSAPTHHAERALLAAWFGMALVIVGAAELLSHARRQTRTALAVSALLVVVISSKLRELVPREPFAQRADAVDIGLRARARNLNQLAIDSDDFAFFAIQAAWQAAAHTSARRSRPTQGTPCAVDRRLSAPIANSARRPNPCARHPSLPRTLRSRCWQRERREPRIPTARTVGS